MMELISEIKKPLPSERQEEPYTQYEFRKHTRAGKEVKITIHVMQDTINQIGTEAAEALAYAHAWQKYFNAIAPEKPLNKK